MSTRGRLTEEAVQSPLILEPKIYDRLRISGESLEVFGREFVALLRTRRRQRPSWCPHKHLGTLDNRPDSRQDLDTRSARPHEDDVLALDLNAVIPRRAVQLRPSEALESRRAGPRRLIQVPCSVDEDVAPVTYHFTRFQVGDSDVPLPLALVP